MKPADLIKAWFSFPQNDDPKAIPDPTKFPSPLISLEQPTLDFSQITRAIETAPGLSNAVKHKWTLLVLDVEDVAEELNLKAFDKLTIVDDTLGYIQINLISNSCGRQAYLEMTAARHRSLFIQFLNQQWNQAIPWIILGSLCLSLLAER